MQIADFVSCVPGRWQHRNAHYLSRRGPTGSKNCWHYLSNIKVRRQALEYPNGLKGSLPNSKRVSRGTYCKQLYTCITCTLGQSFSPGRIGLLQGTALCSRSIAKETQREFTNREKWHFEGLCSWLNTGRTVRMHVFPFCFPFALLDGCKDGQQVPNCSTLALFVTRIWFGSQRPTAMCAGGPERIWSWQYGRCFADLCCFARLEMVPPCHLWLQQLGRC